jgi:DNA polymerase-3 subunit delta'
MINKEIYSWNQGYWAQYCAHLESRTLPHALLLTGAPGIGKKALAASMAESLLCENRSPDGSACGLCASCHWFKAGSHPDLRLIRPALIAAQEGHAEEPGEGDTAGVSGAAEAGGGDKKLSKEISIAQIRALGDFCAMTAVRNGVRIAMIYPAESMNNSAANALLKVLEEPGEQFHFFLITDAPHRLLPTIRSRCRTWLIKAPDRHAALEWLSQHNLDRAEHKLAALGGSPLRLLELEPTAYWDTLDLLLTALSEPAHLDAPALAKQLENAIKLNEKERQSGAAHSLDLPLILGWLQRWTLDVLYCQSGVPIRYHPQRQTAIERATVTVHSTAWLNYWHWLNRAVREAHHPVNMALFLEDCLLRYPALNLAHKGR